MNKYIIEKDLHLALCERKRLDRGKNLRFVPERKREGRERARELPAVCVPSRYYRVYLYIGRQCSSHEEESGGGYSTDLTQFHREDSLKDTA